MKFRQAVGAIILNKNGDIIAFQRKDFPENWQGPEGGIDNNETPEEALYRELYEEINLKKDEYEIVNKTKDFIQYLFKDNKQKFGFDGQEKRFYLIKLKNNENFKFDNTEEIEFISSEIIKADSLIEKVPTFKKEMYEKVLKEFGLLNDKITR